MVKVVGWMVVNGGSFGDQGVRLNGVVLHASNGRGGLGQPPSQPTMPEGLARGHSQGRVPLQATLEKVREEGIVAAFQGRRPLLGTGRTPELTSPGAAGVQHSATVGRRRYLAITRVAFGTDEIFRPFRLLDEARRRHPQELDGASQLIAFVLARQ